MRVRKIVRDVMRTCGEQVHAARLACIASVVSAIITANRLVPAAIGRAVAVGTTPKHGIKRVDRFLGSKHAFKELPEYYGALALAVIGGTREPRILIDWTDLVGKFKALDASVVFEGRAISIYREVHPESRLGNSKTQERFLKRLRAVLPPSCIPIIVSDAGFHGPFFRTVRDLGWHFVGRIRGTAKAKSKSGVHTKEEFYSRATLTPADLGPHTLYTRSKHVEARLILVRKRRRPGRRKPAKTEDERELRRQAKDPWLLATSLDPRIDPAGVVRIYAQRMQIEETFRDLKTTRFGWSLEQTRSHSRKRLAVLLFLAAAATLVAMIAGKCAEHLKLARHYQANTVKRRVLSLFTLGLNYLARACGRLPSGTQALRLLRDSVRTACIA